MQSLQLDFELAIFIEELVKLNFDWFQLFIVLIIFDLSLDIKLHSLNYSWYNIVVV